MATLTRSTQPDEAPGSAVRRVGHPARNDRRVVVEALPIGTYGAMLRRQRRILAVAVAAGLLFGFAAVWTTPPTWVSGASVILPAVPKDPQARLDRAVRPARAVTLDTEAALLLSDSVLTRAVSGTDVTPSELASRVTLIAVPNSWVLRVQVTDLDRQVAKQLSGNLAAAYLDARQQSLQQRRSQQSESLRRQIAALQGPGRVTIEALAALRAEAGEGSLAGDNGVIATGATGTEAQLRTLRYRLQLLESLPVSGGEMLRAASEPRKVRSRAQVSVISWLVGALAVAGLIIAWRERRPPRPRSGVDVLRLPFMDGVPVGILRRTRHVHDPDVGWVRMVAAIGSVPRVVTVVPLAPELRHIGVENLAEILRRRGQGCDRFVLLDHQDVEQLEPVRRSLRAGRHAICAGSTVADFSRSLTATITDRVVLVSHARTTPDELRRAMTEMSRLGMEVTGLVLDERRLPSATKKRRPKIPVPRTSGSAQDRGP